jgi:hypothetical protein
MEFLISLDELTQACHEAGYKYALRQMMGRLLTNEVVTTMISGDFRTLDLAPTREEVDKATNKL